MNDKGTLEERRLFRYRQRVSDLIRKSLEDLFWTDQKKRVLKESTQSLDSINIAPHLMAEELLGNQEIG